jgi:hypothetical protein
MLLWQHSTPHLTSVACMAWISIRPPEHPWRLKMLALSARPRSTSCAGSLLSGALPPFGYFSDAIISRGNQLTGTQRRFLEVMRIRWNHLPVGHSLPEHLNRSHTRKLPPQTLVVFFRCRQPNAIVLGRLAPIAEDENNLLLKVYRQASEHPPRARRERFHCIQDKLVRCSRALFGNLRRNKTFYCFTAASGQVSPAFTSETNPTAPLPGPSRYRSGHIARLCASWPIAGVSDRWIRRWFRWWPWKS